MNLLTLDCDQILKLGTLYPKGIGQEYSRILGIRAEGKLESEGDSKLSPLMTRAVRSR